MHLFDFLNIFTRSRDLNGLCLMDILNMDGSSLELEKSKKGSYHFPEFFPTLTPLFFLIKNKKG